MPLIELISLDQLLKMNCSPNIQLLLQQNRDIFSSADDVCSLSVIVGVSSSVFFLKLGQCCRFVYKLISAKQF